MPPLQSWLPVLLLAVGASTLSAQPTVALRDVRVIDLESGSASGTPVTVIVENGRIRFVGDPAEAPESAIAFDGKGRYVIPGLWDMHAHAFWSKDNPERMFPLFVANGVTGIRDLGSPLSIAEIGRMRAKYDSSATVPRLALAYRLVDGDPPVWKGSLAVADVKTARSAVAALRQAGADVLKVYARLSKEAYFAVAAEAAREKLPVVGHIPLAVRAIEAARARQRTIEHSSELLLACSSREAELRGELLAAFSGEERNRIRARQLQQLVETYAEKKARKLADAFRKSGVMQTPTLVVNGSYAYPPEDGFASQAWARYLPKKKAQGFDSRAAGYRDSLTDDQRKWLGLSYEKELEFIRLMHARGVEFLVGTDAELFQAAGFGVHRELELLVGAGFSPVEALRAATFNPAKSLGRANDFGAIKPGRLADMVILGANPLEDISNTQKIAAVVLKGRLFDRDELDQLLSTARDLARTVP